MSDAHKPGECNCWRCCHSRAAITAGAEPGDSVCMAHPETAHPCPCGSGSMIVNEPVEEKT